MTKRTNKLTARQDLDRRAAARLALDIEAATTAAHLAAGIAHLSAQPHGDGLAYYEEGTRAWYAVSESDVAELGRRLAADPGAYSEWCADTMSTNLTEELCHAYEAAHPGRLAAHELRDVVCDAQREGGPGVSVADIVVAVEEES